MLILLRLLQQITQDRKLMTSWLRTFIVGQEEIMFSILLILHSLRDLLLLTTMLKVLTGLQARNCPVTGEAFTNIFMTQMLHTKDLGRCLAIVKNLLTGKTHMVRHLTRLQMMFYGTQWLLNRVDTESLASRIISL